MDRIRVLLADDQALIRAGFRMILESEPGIEVVGEAVDGREAVEATLALVPDVVCMDVQMPGVDGLTATRQIVATNAASKVIVLTTFNNDDYLFEALEAGASGFLLKTTSPEDLVKAVQVVAHGDALLAPEVTRRVIERSAFARRRPCEDTHIGDLTKRERDVLVLIAQGLTNAEIAMMLHLGEATVKTHVSHMLLKLGMRDRTHLVIWSYENGVVVPRI